MELLESAKECAPRLLGCLLVRNLNEKQLVGKIVETEAYDQTDAASHSFNGVTSRTAVMFGPPGHAYVYFTYGMHFCMNIVCAPVGHGSAVLIRALEPLEGVKVMQENRGIIDKISLANGPAKLCQAMQINRDLNGHDLRCEPLLLLAGAPVPKSSIVASKRIGISKATDKPWRFFIKDNPYVSRGG